MEQKNNKDDMEIQELEGDPDYNYFVGAGRTMPTLFDEVQGRDYEKSQCMLYSVINKYCR